MNTARAAHCSLFPELAKSRGRAAALTLWVMVGHCLSWLSLTGLYLLFLITGHQDITRHVRGLSYVFRIPPLININSGNSSALSSFYPYRYMKACEKGFAWHSKRASYYIHTNIFWANTPQRQITAVTNPPFSLPGISSADSWGLIQVLPLQYWGMWDFSLKFRPYPGHQNEKIQEVAKHSR